MTPRWERISSAPALRGKLYFDAELRPHRSLSSSAFRLMLIVVIIANAAVAAVFIARGAFPVAGFLGLDVFALWLAFRLNYRAGQAVEHVRLAADRMHVAATAPSGRASHWVLNPIWAQIAREGPGVLIRAGGGQMRVGAFLPPEECESFANALAAALHRARRGL